MSVSAGLTSRMTLEFLSCVNLKVVYIFHKVTTNIWPLVDVRKFYVIDILVEFNHVSMVIMFYLMDLFCDFQIL